MKTILITGASRGIGRATALGAGRIGWSVVVNYVGDKAAADEVVALVKAAGGKASRSPSKDVRRQHPRRLSLRQGGRAPALDEQRRPRRFHCVALVGSGSSRIPLRIRRLCGIEGGGRHAGSRARQGIGARGRPGKFGAPWSYRHGNTRQRRTARPCSQAGRNVAAWPAGPSGRSGGGHHLAARRPGLICDRSDPRRFRRSLTKPGACQCARRCEGDVDRNRSTNRRCAAISGVVTRGSVS